MRAVRFASLSGKLLWRFVSALVLLWTSVFSASADFGDIDVRMQSGDTAVLNSLPWFELARGLLSNSYRSQAHFYEWSIHAPPPMCPFHYYWQVRTRDPIDPYLEVGRKKCDLMMDEKLAHLPESVRKVCACRLILRTESVQKIGQRALWRSLDDAQLQSDELRIGRTLRHETETLPVLFSIGGQQAGLYDYSGHPLCRPLIDQTSNDIVQSGRKSLTQIMSARAKVRVTCFQRWAGTLDSSGLSYNWLTQKTTGDIVLQLDNGEKYVLSP